MTDPGIPLDDYRSCLEKVFVERKLVRRGQKLSLRLSHFKDMRTLYFIAAVDGTEFLVKATDRMKNAGSTSLVLEFLHSKGLNVIPFVGSDLGITIQGHRLKVYISRFLNARACTFSLDDFGAFLDVIEPVHKALETFPGKDRIQRNSQAYTQSLNEIKNRLVQASNQRLDPYFGIFSEWVSTNAVFLTQAMPALVLTMHRDARAQCLHGDLHPGNVLFPEKGLPFIIDFDACETLFAPLSYDLAYMLFRFCILEPSRNQDLFMKKVRMLYKVYGDRMPSLKELTDMIQTISLKLIVMVLSNYLTGGVESSVAELEKFKLHYLLMEEKKSSIL